MFDTSFFKFVEKFANKIKITLVSNLY